MCKGKLHEFLQNVPKVEQHMHVEGSLMPSTLFALAKRNKIQLPQNDRAYESEEALLERYRNFSSLDDFLHYYYEAMRVLVTQEDFEQLAYSYFQKAHADAVMHAEIFFDPQAHIERGVPFETVVEGLQAARRKATAELGMSTELICCFLRHEPAVAATALFDSIDMQTALKKGIITGIGLDSSEKPYPPELFSELYSKAHAMGLKTTAHAGEEGPCQNIASSLDVIGCDRIDHGVRLAENEELMAQVARRGTLLTVCPLSNVYLRCFERIEQVPIRKFLDAGVQFSINSDDPAYLGGFILDNYCAVQQAFNLSMTEWEGICRAAILGSWCGEERKDEMRARLHQVMLRYRSLE